MKRRTKKQWYQFHLAQTQQIECAKVHESLADEFDRIDEAELAAQFALREAKCKESTWSRIASVFGLITSYRRKCILPFLEDIKKVERARADLILRRNLEIAEALKVGEQVYLKSREARRSEAELRASRVAAEKAENRIRYLERSPAIRSAAKYFRRLLLKEALGEQDFILCYYCKGKIAPADSHLEHKVPISRGGGNNRSNLVLSCSACNLKKGKKTHDEFLRLIQNGK